MAAHHRVHELVGYVTGGKILDAIEEFYADDVQMQENTAPPTVGKEANRERERAFVASVVEVHENRAEAIVADANRTAIHWVFDFTNAEGRRFRFDQVALQTWRDGKIVRERFFYDPDSLAA